MSIPPSVALIDAISLPLFGTLIEATSLPFLVKLIEEMSLPPSITLIDAISLPPPSSTLIHTTRRRSSTQCHFQPPQSRRDLPRSVAVIDAGSLQRNQSRFHRMSHINAFTLVRERERERE